MVTPVRPCFQRPIDALDQLQTLTDILDAFGHGRAWVAPWESVQPSSAGPYELPAGGQQTSSPAGKAAPTWVEPTGRPGSHRHVQAGGWPSYDTRSGCPVLVDDRCHHEYMSAPTVDAVINDLMDWAWHAVYELLAQCGLLGDGLAIEEYTGLTSWVEGTTRYTVVHSPSVAVLFLDTDPVDAIPFHRDLLGSADPKSLFNFQGSRP